LASVFSKIDFLCDINALGGRARSARWSGVFKSSRPTAGHMGPLPSASLLGLDRVNLGRAVSTSASMVDGAFPRAFAAQQKIWLGAGMAAAESCS
jgi:hypothetical protein